MILPNQKTPHAWRVTTPDGAYILETLFHQPERGGDLTGFDLRLLDKSGQSLLTLPMTQWNDPVGFFEGRFTFSLAYNGRRAAVRIDPARRTFVFQPTDAPEPLALLPDRLQKMFGKPLPVGSLPRVSPAPANAGDWNTPPPRNAILLHAALALFNFTTGAVLLYLPSRPGWTPPQLLLAAIVLLTGLLAQLLALPRLFPQLSSASASASAR